MRGKNWYIEYGALPIVGDMYADDWRDLLKNVKIQLPVGERKVFFLWLDSQPDSACYEMFIPIAPPMSDDFVNRCTKYRFRLLDDDGVIYAYGCSADNSSFAPLDWAESVWGCTCIEYYDLETGEWEPL